MLNQQVSIDEIDCPDARSTALSPLPSGNDIRAVDPELKARLIRAAAASGRLSPHVLPGAAALLLPLDLPLKSDRQRRAAARFAMEPHLARALEDTHVAVGPTLHGTVRLCAAIDRAQAPLNVTGCALPDLCAVPLPTVPDGWALWCADHATYIRTFDGGGCVVSPHSFTDLWRAFRQPPLELWHGQAPLGVDVTRPDDQIPLVDPSLFDLDLRLEKRSTHAQWRGRVGFAIALSALTGVAHAAVLLADAQALERTVADRRAAVLEHIAARGATVNFDRPTRAMTADLVRQAQATNTPDPFLGLLSRIGIALTGNGDVVFRDLRYAGASGNLTILLSATDLVALQKAEDALRTAGLSVESGAASNGATGAEMQLTLTEAR